MLRFNQLRLVTLIVCIFAVISSVVLTRADNSASISVTVQATPPPLPGGSTSRNYLAKPSFAPEQARFFDLITKQLPLNVDETKLLTQNGFVISDRLAFENFILAYAYIYKYDLPVLITTDSMFYAVHKGYDNFMQELEESVLPAKVFKSLRQSRDAVRKAAAANTDERLKPLYADLDLYLSVPMVFLTAPENNPYAKYNPTPGAGTPTPEPVDLDVPNISKYLQLVRDAGGFNDVNLFGEGREVDFSLFKPRSRYTRTTLLSNYFRAMSWLIQVDFRLLQINERGQIIYNPGHAATAFIFEDALRNSGMDTNWQTIDKIFTELVGTGGNITLPNLKRLLTDAGIKSAANAFSVNTQQFIDVLSKGNYGQNYALPTAGAIRPTSFRLVGARYTIDTSVMIGMVHDAVGLRAFPSPFDVMYALGNDRARDHLKDELQRYNYQPQLDGMRKAVEQVPDERWSDSFYNRWLTLIRKLNNPTTGKEFPQAMRTAAWADKTLHTQLGAWTQLRHDNILLVPPSAPYSQSLRVPGGLCRTIPGFLCSTDRLCARWSKAVCHD